MPKFKSRKFLPDKLNPFSWRKNLKQSTVEEILQRDKEYYKSLRKYFELKEA